MAIENERIGNVILDYSQYDGEDLYSDGSVEDDILEIVRQNKDYNLAISKDDRFAVLYHLAKDREAVVQIMDISKTDRVLEIGAGCGAVTGALARNAGYVDCVELSRKRSLINANRNREYDNLRIKVANFQRVNLEPVYDVVTLIGVLEYAVYYVGGENPFHRLLEKAKNLLKPNGRLYIAIENRFGIKYFAGAQEDHLGVEFAGIEGYSGKSHVKTFSRTELVKLLAESGYEPPVFYYPFPDYKFPKVIYRDEMVPSPDEIGTVYSNYGAKRNAYFDEKKALASMLDTDDWKMFANSFLIEARV